MKKIDIQKIRQSLKDAKNKILQGGNYPITYKNGYVAGIDQALALLPCETCNGTGQCKDLKAGDSNMLTLMPCPNPDCQS